MSKFLDKLNFNKFKVKIKYDTEVSIYNIYSPNREFQTVDAAKKQFSLIKKSFLPSDAKNIRGIIYQTESEKSKGMERIIEEIEL